MVRLDQFEPDCGAGGEGGKGGVGQADHRNAPVTQGLCLRGAFGGIWRETDGKGGVRRGGLGQQVIVIADGSADDLTGPYM